MDSQALTATLDRWQNGIKSPNFVPVAIKFSLLMAIPLFAFFQDFKEVFILAFSTAESQYILLVPFVIAYFFIVVERHFWFQVRNLIYMISWVYHFV